MFCLRRGGAVEEGIRRAREVVGAKAGHVRWVTETHLRARVRFACGDWGDALLVNDRVSGFYS